MYFIFIGATGFAGLVLATLIRIELAYPGQVIMGNNAERYLTVAALHGIVMVFFVVIPVLFGAFGNFLLPTQLGVRDVAFPRLNSFMFWVTPGGFILLLHIFFFDRSATSVFPINHAALTKSLQRKYFPSTPARVETHLGRPHTLAELRALQPALVDSPRGALLARFGLSTDERLEAALLSSAWPSDLFEPTHVMPAPQAALPALDSFPSPSPLTHVTPDAGLRVAPNTPAASQVEVCLNEALARLETEREMVRQAVALAGGRAH